MTVKRIIKMGNPLLREVAEIFTKEEILSDEVKMLMDDLTAFMEDYKSWENVGSIGRNSLWD